MGDQETVTSIHSAPELQPWGDTGAERIILSEGDNHVSSTSGSMFSNLDLDLNFELFPFGQVCRYTNTHHVPCFNLFIFLSFLLVLTFAP